MNEYPNGLSGGQRAELNRAIKAGEMRGLTTKLVVACLSPGTALDINEDIEQYFIEKEKKAKEGAE